METSSIFPKDMLRNQGTEMSPDIIATKLSWFELQLHNLHWNTRTYSEHVCLGALYDKVFDLKDEIVEKVMGYTGTRASIGKIDAIKPYGIGVSESVVNELKSFAKQLETYASLNNMPDIENISQSLSGDAVKTLYLLTLS
jgi:DNA-binding ferritin-like protein